MFRALRRLDEFMGRKFGSGTALSLKVRAPWPSAACCRFCRCTMLCVAHGKLHVVHVACSVHQCMPVACRDMAGFFAAARMQHARTMHALLHCWLVSARPRSPLGLSAGAWVELGFGAACATPGRFEGYS